MQELGTCECNGARHVSLLCQLLSRTPAVKRGRAANGEVDRPATKVTGRPKPPHHCRS